VLPNPVTVTVDWLEVRAFDGESAHLAMRVTPGFYVRSMAHDLGAMLGMGAVLTALRRTRSGDYAEATAVPLGEVIDGDRKALAARVIPFDSLLGGLPAVVLKAGVPQRVKNGLEVGPNDATGSFGEPSELVRFIGPDGRLVGLAKPGKTPGFLHAAVVFG
jgi:tRNA pseudouridine55 synthase